MVSMRAAVLSARGLTKSFGSFKAVDSVNLDIPKARFTPCRPNGAGKTTVLNLLGGQLLPTAGEIRFAADPRRQPAQRSSACRRRSVIPVDDIIPPCLDNVLIAVQANAVLRLLRPQPRRMRSTRASCWPQRSDAAGMAADVGARSAAPVEIAMALGGRPRVLLLDEPSSGMSGHERQGLGVLLQQVAQKTTIVMAEHDVHLVHAVATRVTAFSEGRTVAEGTAEEVFQAPEVQRVFLRGVRDV
jgi:branched-chain amino acid transport system ATP-binding protein